MKKLVLAGAVAATMKLPTEASAGLIKMYQIQASLAMEYQR